MRKAEDREDEGKGGKGKRDMKDEEEKSKKGHRYKWTGVRAATQAAMGLKKMSKGGRARGKGGWVCMRGGRGQRRDKETRWGREINKIKRDWKGGQVRLERAEIEGEEELEGIGKDRWRMKVEDKETGLYIT